MCAWYDDLSQVLAQECQQKPHLHLRWLQEGPHHFPTSQKFPCHPSGNPPQLMNTSKFYEHFRFLWTLSWLSHITHTREHLGQWTHRSGVTPREHSVKMVQYHIYLSPQVNILSWTAGIVTQFMRWGMGEWPGKFELYNWSIQSKKNCADKNLDNFIWAAGVWKSRELDIREETSVVIPELTTEVVGSPAPVATLEPQAASLCCTVCHGTHQHWVMASEKLSSWGCNWLIESWNVTWLWLWPSS